MDPKVEESYSERIQHLQEAHRVADLQLHELEKHPHVEEQKVAELKKLKLKYKDEIVRLRQMDENK